MSSSELTWQLGNAKTLVDLLQTRARHQADRKACTFLRDGEVDGGSLTYGALDLKARAIARKFQADGATGKQALLLYPTGLEFVAAFFGCLYAGVLGVPCFPPRRNRVDVRLQSILADSGATFALTTGALLADAEAWFSQMPELKTLAWLGTDTVGDDASGWRHPDISGDTLAFLQYTSGSTSSPKGVMVSHYNLLHNMAHLDQGWDHNEHSVMVSWLPIFHDMGLIYGLLVPIFKGFPAYMLPPASFLQRPVRWLHAISKYRGTHSAAPNFSYDLCVRSATEEDKRGLDLSSWVMTLNAAEPVREETMVQFEKVFGPCGFSAKTFSPGFGLAEATLKVTALGKDVARTVLYLNADELALHRVVEGRPGEPGVIAVNGCGPRVDDTRVAIVDPETKVEFPPDRVGEIWASGSTMAQGYWNKPEETERTFNAHLAGTGEGPFMRTGDLGFMHGDELYVTGRLKDMIIVHGLNHYPHDIELTVERSHPSLRPSGGAAFSVTRDGEESLVVLQEVERTYLRKFDVDAVAELVRRAVFEEHGLKISALVFIRTGTILKTTSGKIQRHACRKAFLAGELEVVGAWRPASTTNAGVDPAPAADPVQRSEGEIREWLIARISEELNLPVTALDPTRSFSSYGLDSVGVVRLSGRLESWLGRKVSPTIAYDFPSVNAVARFFVDASGEASTKNHARSAAEREAEWRGRNGSEEPVAVIGMECRFPGADNTEAFWTLLRDGVDAISTVPSARWNEDAVGANVSRWGGFVANIDMFDADFFGISPREAEKMDPQQRLLLETAWHALENAGQAPAELAGSRTGVFVGISNSDYMRLQFAQSADLDIYAGTGNALSVAANRLSYLLDLTGPSMVVDTACSSSLVAVHLACRSLASGESSLAIAGGVNLILSPEWTIAFSRAGMMASDGRCKTFDAAADGYVRGEGAGVVVLKRLSDAVRDGDPIHGIIRGTAVNQDGRSNGLTAPNGPAQQAVVRAALNNAGIAPNLVGYVEAHGTGTSLGDPIEVNSLREVLMTGRQADQPCRIGSVKTNIGHLESAAGIAGLIKVLLALRHRTIPANLHFSKLNPHIDLGDGSLSIPVASLDWPAIEGRRIAGVSSFGFGGANAHVVVEEGGEPAKRKAALPLHQFKRERFWLKSLAKSVTNGLLYEVVWQKKLLPACGDTPGAGAWLVLADKSGLGGKLAAALETRGRICITVFPGDEGAKGGDFGRIIGDVVARTGAPLAGIVYLWALDVSGMGPAFEVDSSEMPGCAGVFKLVQELAGRSGESSARLWVVTKDAVAVDASSAVSPVGAGLVGLGRVIALEYPELWGGILDVSGEDSADLMASEIMGPDGETLVALRADERHVPRLVRKSLPHGSEKKFTGDGVVLVTGGCGALGLKISSWLVERGARDLVLTGRSGETETARVVLDGLRATGVAIRVERADVACYDDMARVFDGIRATGRRCCGIIHAAGVIEDSTIQRMDTDRFSRVMRPKAQGAWNLHRLTESMPLDFFVMFSSVASLLGSAGQSNYAAANAFMDRLAVYRRSRGLPALSVNWGLWSDAGMAGRLDDKHRVRLAARGLHPLDAATALNVLGALLSLDTLSNVGVMQMDWPVFCGQQSMPLLSELVPPVPGAVSQGVPDVAENVRRVTVDEKGAVGYAKELLAAILRREVARLDDVKRGFFDMGMDSLMAIELKNRIEKDFSRKFPVTVAFEHSSIGALAAYLRKELLATPEATLAKPLQRRAEMPGVEEISRMSEAETSALIDAELKALLQ